MKWHQTRQMEDEYGNIEESKTEGQSKFTGYKRTK